MDDELNEFEFLFDPEQQAFIERSLKEKLISFFSKYSFYCGGNIPHKLICSNDSLNLVFNVQFDPGIKYVYDYILPSFKKPLINSTQIEVSWDIELILKLLESCRESHIPIEYQAGIVILYFKFCRGAKVSYESYQTWQVKEALVAA